VHLEPRRVRLLLSRTNERELRSLVGELNGLVGDATYIIDLQRARFARIGAAFEKLMGVLEEMGTNGVSRDVLDAAIADVSCELGIERISVSIECVDKFTPAIVAMLAKIDVASLTKPAVVSPELAAVMIEAVDKQNAAAFTEAQRVASPAIEIYPDDNPPRLVQRFPPGQSPF
jgi:hypothetical protein